MKRLIIAIFVLLMTLAPAEAQRPTVKASMDSTYVTIGMPMTFHLEATVPEGETIAFPDVVKDRGVVCYDDTLQFLLELDEAPKLDTVQNESGVLTLREDVRVFAFDSATLYIPPFAFVTERGDTLRTNSLALKVFVPFDSIEVDPQKFCDIKPVVDPEFVIWDYASWLIWPLAIMAVCGLFCLIFIWWLNHNGRKTVVTAPKEKPLPPHVVALNALDELAAKQLWQKGEDKAYQTELTDVLRVYIEQRFGVPALEKTSDEIIDELYELAQSQNASLKNLKQILALADLVKFAKYHPLPDDNQLSFMNAKMFVTQTKLEEVPSADEKAESSDEKGEVTK